MVLDFQYQYEKLIESGKTFFNSNSLISKIVFFILVIFCFILLLRLGTTIISYILAPKPNITILNGLHNGNKQQQFSTNPSINGSKPILRSNNQMNGIAFTWSSWVYIDGSQLDNNKDKFRHIFNKGNNNMGPDGIMEPNNAPGLYISPNNNPNVSEISFLIRMNIFNDSSYGNKLNEINNTCSQIITATTQSLNTDVMTNELIKRCKNEFPYLNKDSITSNSQSDMLVPLLYDDIEIPEIPINKWVSIIIRCESNNILDIYINGRIVKRHILSGVARQNYGDVNVSFGGGFGGFQSELKYFNYAIGISEIDYIVSSGPNLNSDGSDLSHSKPYYLSNKWFYDEINPIYSTPAMY
jgi:hypothetical protein